MAGFSTPSSSGEEEEVASLFMAETVSTALDNLELSSIQAGRDSQQGAYKKLV